MPASCCFTQFTAAQAAQKPDNYANAWSTQFTAAQAAQKFGIYPKP